MRRTPVITLLAGFAVAAVLLVMSSIAAKNASKPKPPAAAPTTAAASPTPAAPKVTATWAGKVDGGGASIAIAVKDGVAVAYLCDGKVGEIWMQGTAEAGKLTLTSKDGASLTGTFGNGKAEGTITSPNANWKFTAPTAQPPSGLYRLAKLVESAKVVCGWVVLPDGTQVGVCSEEGKDPEPAPYLNTADTPPIDPGNLS